VWMNCHADGQPAGDEGGHAATEVLDGEKWTAVLFVVGHPSMCAVADAWAEAGRLGRCVGGSKAEVLGRCLPLGSRATQQLPACARGEARRHIVFFFVPHSFIFL
jgi:hypothetical protein